MKKLTIMNELEGLMGDVEELLEDIELIEVDSKILIDIFNKIDKSRDYLLDAKDTLYINE